MTKNNRKNFEFAMELLNQLIDSFDEYSWISGSAENVRRLERSREYLRKAYVVATPILFEKEI